MFQKIDASHIMTGQIHTMFVYDVFILIINK